VVGTVETVTRGATATDRRIGIRPAVDFSYLDVVLVVITPPACWGPQVKLTSILVTLAVAVSSR
jgi:cell shape-determining protein MreC